MSSMSLRPWNARTTPISHREVNKRLLANLESMRLFLSTYEGEIPGDVILSVTENGGKIYLPDGAVNPRTHVVDEFARLNNVEVTKGRQGAFETYAAKAGHLTMYTIVMRGGESS